MNAILFSDAEFPGELTDRVKNVVTACLTERAYEIRELSVGRDELKFCTGCFGCWVKKPGQCVIQDKIEEINRACMVSDVAIYLSPVVFGQFSANMKTMVDRWLPNMLPFFVIRTDGSTIHPPRYDDYPAIVMIGYGETMTPEDGQLFTDINKKHRHNVEALLYQGNEEALKTELSKLQLVRKGGSL